MSEFDAILGGLKSFAERNDRIGVVDQFEQDKRKERQKRLAKVADASLRGDHGDAAQELAQQYFNLDPSRADLERLENYLRDLQRLNIDVHSMPSRVRGGGKRYRDE